MRSFSIFCLFAIILNICSCGPQKLSSLKNSSFTDSNYRSTRWLDGRPKLIVDPENQPLGLTHDNLVRAWLRQAASQLDISPRLENIRLQRVRRSSKGIHYEFVTPDGAGTVHNSVLIVSLTADGSRIYRAYNGLLSKADPNLTHNLVKISKDQALDTAWKHLDVTGKILSEPSAKLVFAEINGALKQWWQVNIESTAPAGSWEYWIDPTSGKIAHSMDRRVYDVSRASATEEFRKRKSRPDLETIRHFNSSSFDSIVGSARIFAVDPRTALKSEELNDNSAPDSFQNAYETKPIVDIAKTQLGYELIGRRTALADWDVPFSGTSVTSDGHWNFSRGENQFNDSMTWWHLNESIKSLEQLGFENDASVFTGALIADADGFDGDDNSFFTPTINALSFGHGCIDDNEDPDVILHEMGHAINHAINPYWKGGDTGAMGEGFGDYWATSYGFADPRNRTGDKFRVFNWDGSADCWDGRRTDRLDAKYKRGSNYRAHDRGSDGIVSDEIWSTPLVSSLDELINKNIPREQVDLIVIESQFGLAHGLTMTDWANALVQTATMLFPEGPHAEVFSKNFARHLILTERTPDLIFSNQIFESVGRNGVPDPGETFKFNIELFNIGDGTARQVRAKLISKSEWANVVNEHIQYGDIEELKKSKALEPFIVSIHPEVACGQLTQMEAVLTDDQQRQFSVPINFSLGVANAEFDTFNRAPNTQIPDHNKEGISDALEIRHVDGATIRDGFSIDITVTHSSVTDLKLVLTSPAGHEVVLKSFLSGDRSAQGIIGNFPNTLQPVEGFSQLFGLPISGVWSLKVVDGFEGGNGALLAWGIRNPTGKALCEK